MGNLRKFNEYFYEGSEKPESEIGSLEELNSGEVNELNMGDFTVTKPSELDGKFLVVNKDGKHTKAETEQEVMDILSGKKVLESKKHRRH